MQILAIALLFHSLCSAQQQQPLFQITPVHNINTYKAILATTALRLFSCVTALGGLLFTVPLAIPSFLLSSLYHYSYMRHSLDTYVFFASRIIFHHGSCISKWSGTLLLLHCNTSELLHFEESNNVVLVLLQHNSFCHYFDDAVAVKDWFIQAYLSKKLFFKGSPFLAALSALYLREWVTHDHQFRVIDEGMHANLIR